MRLIVPVRVGGLAASPDHLKSGRIQVVVARWYIRERVEDVTLCTLTGHCGQDEFHGLFDSVRSLIGKIDRQTLPKRRSDYFRHFRSIVTRGISGPTDFSRKLSASPSKPPSIPPPRESRHNRTEVASLRCAAKTGTNKKPPRDVGVLGELMGLIDQCGEQSRSLAKWFDVTEGLLPSFLRPFLQHPSCRPSCPFRPCRCRFLASCSIA